MGIYNKIQDAVYDIENKNISIYKRDIAFKYVLMDYKASFYCLIKKLYNNDMERNTLMNKVIRSDTKCLKLLLKYENLLTQSEKIEIINVILQDYKKCLILIKQYKSLDKDTRFKAINIIMLSIQYTNKLLIECKLTQEEYIYIINKFKDNIDICYTYMIYIKNGPSRDIAFKTISNNKNKLLALIKNYNLLYNEKKIIYEKHGAYFYDKMKYKFEDFYTYCKTFESFISCECKIKLFKKLATNENKHIIPLFLEEFKLHKKCIKCNNKCRDKLESFYILNKLTSINC